MSAEETKSTKAHCNRCGPLRSHEIIGVHRRSWHDRRDHVDGGSDFEMIKCCGCDEVSLRETRWNSECVDENGYETSEVYYPPAKIRSEPRWLSKFDELSQGNSEISEILVEIYRALQAECLRLATMGIRALLENIMIANSGDKGSFRANIVAFEQGGFVSRTQRKFLETVIEAGHATMHRAFSPSRSDLIAILDITESIVESVYLHGDRANSLRQSIPPRAP